MEKLENFELSSFDLLNFQTILDRLKHSSNNILGPDLEDEYYVADETEVDFIYARYFKNLDNETFDRFTEGIKFCLENGQDYYNEEAEDLIQKRFENTDEEEI